jgi:hypothetical protein
MKATSIILFTLLCLCTTGFAQIKWRDTAVATGDISWNNYSTSYIDPKRPDDVCLITAIPYNGRNDNFDGSTPLDMSYTGSLYRFRSFLDEKNVRNFNVFDSSEVYFIAAGVHPENAHLYEYAILRDTADADPHWQPVTRFTDDTFRLNNFKPKMGWLGGYRADWGHAIVVILKEKGGKGMFHSVSSVYWQQVKPQVLGVYSSATLNEFLQTVSDQPVASTGYWTRTYPFQTVVDHDEKNLIFLLWGNFFKREVLEYRIEREGKVYTDWKPNDVDNNYIWLRDVPHGKYHLLLRFRAQRHNVTTFAFEVLPAWYQTGRFRLIAGIFTFVITAAIVLLVLLLRQRRKITLEQLKKAKLQLALQSVYAQLNPHFVFNALHSIQGLINTNDIEGANRYLAVFGNLMRDSLTSNHKDMAPLSKEVSTLDTYLKLEQLRFGFNYTITVDESIDQYETEVPSLFLQPLVENAVKHGVGSLQEQGQIALRFTRQAQDLTVHIGDNGKGFDLNAETNGYGLKLTRSRIVLLNEFLEDQSIELSVHTEAGQSTTIAVLFKNWLA